MAVAFEFIHLFVPMQLIDEMFPGGWPAWLIENENVIGRSAWFDDHVYTQCAMDQRDLQPFADRWKYQFRELFPGPERFDRRWDEAVANYMAERSDKTRDWLERGTYSGWLRGEEPGVEIFRDNVKETERWLHPDRFPPRRALK